MAKGKTDAVDEKRVDVEVHPHPNPLPQGEGMTEPELVTVVAVERLFVAAENRYVQPGELVMLPTATARLLVEIGAAAEAPEVVDEDEGGFVLRPA